MVFVLAYGKYFQKYFQIFRYILNCLLQKVIWLDREVVVSN